MSGSKLQYYCWMFPLWHRGVAAGCVVRVCVVYSGGFLGGYFPRVFEFLAICR